MFFQVDHTKRWPLPRRVACGSFMIKWKGNGNSAKCKLCQKSIKSCGNTTNLIGHIRNVHKLAYRELFNESSNNSNIDNNKWQSVTKIDNLQPSTSSAHLIESIEKDFKIPDSSKDD